MLVVFVIALLIAIAGVTYLLIRLTPAPILEQPPQPLSGFLTRAYRIAVRARSFLNWAASTSLGFTLIAAFLILGGVLIVVLVFSSP